LQRFSSVLPNIVLLAGIPLLLSGCAADEAPAVTGTSLQPAPARYVGGEACAACHADEFARWRGSHHDRAMQVAGSESVLGDFNEAEFTYNGQTSTFSVRNDQYWVSTQGADGQPQEFRITHTFGIYPLQQYLIEFPRGRLQALSIAWDARDPDAGGQRWFHLYPDEAVDSNDPLHWTGTYQNWNTMCAECHSTNLLKNYDAAQDTFGTSWSSINVDCEACHGPGSAHADAPAEHRLAAGRANRAWVFVEDAVTASVQAGTRSGEEIEICAQCHSRRSQLTDDYDPGDAMLDAFRPALLDRGLYHADGQILDEVYVYGSFLQSAMYAAGVTCSDCHEPHSAETRASGNALCTQCHMAEVFDTSAHHRHDAGTAAAQCVNCHMRAETYMVVDPRRDHSFRVPRPDLTVGLGTPNACGDCHGERPAQWAAERVAQWYPDGRHNEFHYAQALHAGRNWLPERAQWLQRVIYDASQPEIVRATALTLLANPVSDVTLDVVERELRGTETLVQLAAIDTLAAMPMSYAIENGQRFLTHELRALRIAAASALAPARAGLSQRRQADLDAALAEFAATQVFNSDRGEGLVNLAGMLVVQGRIMEAEATYRRALEQEPGFTPTYVNLADLYRQTGRESDAQAVLRNGLAIVAEDPGLHFALGLSLVRSGEVGAAIGMLERAVALAADDPYYHYALGIALNSSGEPEQAIAWLESAYARFPGYRDIIFALATILRDSGDIERAVGYARRLRDLAPRDAAADALLAQLEAGR
jgi:predicted CXXCH cytochrome family protein